MNLLLQIDDVLVSGVLIGIPTDHARLWRALVLPPELHLVHRVVVSAASVGLHAARARLEVGSLAQATSTYSYKLSVRKLNEVYIYMTRL